MNEDWQPIDTAPKDGTIIVVRQGKWAPHHAYWKYGRWHPIEYNASHRPTHWRKDARSIMRPAQ